MAMNENEFVENVVRNNDWLNGWYDYMDGDEMAILESDKYKKYKECENVYELHKMLVNFDGAFKYKNLFFFKHWNYGIFVYDINKSYERYVEHLHPEIEFEKFKTIVENLLSKNEKGG